MKLFDESENKYYELLAVLLNGEESYGREEIKEISRQYLRGDLDFEVTDVLFAGEETNRLIFKDDGQVLRPLIEERFPIRTNVVENQAAKALLSTKYIHHFLRSETIEKLKTATLDVTEEWSMEDVTIKNMFSNGDSEKTESMYQKLSVVLEAIRQGKTIRYDNVRFGRVDRKNEEAFPVKLEFSVMNDKLRVYVCKPLRSYFFKMNLDAMSNVSLGEEAIEPARLKKDYLEFVEDNTQKVVLDVEPDNDIIERCFRVFSYYDRRARYDKEEGKYRLEISYMEQDEKEVIKNILSMGSQVVVLEPRHVQKEVYRRILAACKLYEE